MRDLTISMFAVGDRASAITPVAADSMIGDPALDSSAPHHRAAPSQALRRPDRRWRPPPPVHERSRPPPGQAGVPGPPISSSVECV
jgi:hypothetical protein